MCYQRLFDRLLAASIDTLALLATTKTAKRVPASTQTVASAAPPSSILSKMSYQRLFDCLLAALVDTFALLATTKNSKKRLDVAGA